MDPTVIRHRNLDVACALDGAAAGTRVLEWQRLREEAGLEIQPVPGGVRLWLRPAARRAADDLVRREAACCGFLDFELAADGDRLYLDVTSPTDDASPLIAALTGTEGGPGVPAR